MLTAFGVLAATTMLVSYALEDRRRQWNALFAFGCAADCGLGPPDRSVDLRGPRNTLGSRRDPQISRQTGDNMNKTSRLAAIIGVVCGAELVVAAVIGGAGLAAFVSIEAAMVATLLSFVSLWVIFDRRRRNAASSGSAPPPTESCNSEADQRDPGHSPSGDSHSGRDDSQLFVGDGDPD